MFTLRCAQPNLEIIQKSTLSRICLRPNQLIFTRGRNYNFTNEHEQISKNLDIQLPNIKTIFSNLVYFFLCN